jgi:hypothetical protein
MSDIYINIPSTPDQWVRPAEWMPMPDISPTDQKIAALYAVYENDYNQMNVRFNNIASYIDWGDGTAGTVAGLTLQEHLYDYSTLTGSVYQDEYGENYKQVMIIATGSGGNYSTINFPYTTTYNSAGSRNILDWTFAWSGSAAFLNTTGKFPRCQRFRYLSTYLGGNINSYNSIQFPNLRYLELPSGSSITSGQSTFAYMGPLSNTLDLYLKNTGTSLAMWQNFKGSKFGNLTIDTSTIIQSIFATSVNLQTIGGITGSSVTNAGSAFSNCTSLTSIGVIHLPAVTNITSMFLSCISLREIIFTNCSTVTTTTSTFVNCFSLSSLRMPNIASTFTIAACDLQRDALVALFNDLAVVVSKTITITGNPGVPNLSAADLQIATDKGWTVTS